MMDAKMKEAIYMYQNGRKLKDIVDVTGIFPATMYANLKRMGIGKRTKNVLKINISIDDDVQKIIKKENPGNLSAWICEKIKKASR